MISLNRFPYYNLQSTVFTLSRRTYIIQTPIPDYGNLMMIYDELYSMISSKCSVSLPFHTLKVCMCWSCHAHPSVFISLTDNGQVKKTRFQNSMSQTLEVLFVRLIRYSHSHDKLYFVRCVRGDDSIVLRKICFRNTISM